MSTLAQLFSTVNEMFNISFNLLGYYVTWGNIFTFTVLVAVCGFILCKMLFFY